MRPIFKMAVTAALVAASAFAYEWSGQLVDANCANPLGGVHACDVDTGTTQFGLVVAGKAYLFDAKGNRKAVEALKFRADYPVDVRPGAPVNVTVEGENAGKTILVKRIYFE